MGNIPFIRRINIISPSVCKNRNLMKKRTFSAHASVHHLLLQVRAITTQHSTNLKTEKQNALVNVASAILFVCKKNLILSIVTS